MDLSRYYQKLGLPANTPFEEVKTTYKAIAKKHHPDKNPGNSEAERIFKEAAEAYAKIETAEEKKGREPAHPPPRATFKDRIASMAAEQKRQNADNQKEYEQRRDELRRKSSTPYTRDVVNPDLWPKATIPLSQIPKRKGGEIGFEARLADILERDRGRAYNSFPATEKDKWAELYARSILEDALKVYTPAALTITTSALNEAGSLEKMILVASSAQLILGAGWIGKECIYVEEFGRLAKSTLKQYNGEERMTDFARLARKGYVFVDEGLGVVGAARVHSAIVNLALSYEFSSKEAGDILGGIDRLPLDKRFCAGKTVERRLKEFFDIANELRSKGHTPAHLEKLLGEITRMDKNAFLRMGLTYMRNVVPLFRQMGEMIAPSDVDKLPDFIKHIGEAARGYRRNSTIMEEWRTAFTETLELYKEDPALFKRATDVFSVLKKDEKGTVEWWPGVFHVPLGSVSYGIKKLIDRVKEDASAEKDLAGFRDFLGGYIKSPHGRYRTKKIAGLTLKPAEEEAYAFMREIHRGRKGIVSARVVLKEDVDRLLELYDKN
ncbi:MAG: DnaJ domain-containing protein [Candidatus Nanoarchaeia archaeon]